MIIKIFISLGIVALIIGGLVAVKAKQIGQMIEEGQQAWPASPITSFTAFSEQLEKTIASVGSLEANEGVMLSADLGGRIEAIHFQSGQIVSKGDKIISIDTSTEEAEKKAVQASLDLAAIDLKRAEDLLQSRTISQAEFDSTQAQYKETLARLNNVQAAIDKKIIRAPFDGRLGIRQVNLGQIIASGTPIVSLQNTQTLLVNFSLPQRHLSKVETGMTVRIQDPNQPEHRQTGTLSTISPQLNNSTRTLSLQAQFTNDGYWLPGMFVEVSLLLPDEESVVLIPISSILYAPYGNSVFVVEESADNTLQLTQKFIKLGGTQGDFVSVSEGVAPGDIVASTGVFKLSNKMSVFVDNSKAPPFSLHPQPEDQ